MVDWVRSFPDSTLGIMNCKYLDFYNNHQGFNSCKKGSLFPFTVESRWDSGTVHLRGVCMWTGSDQIIQLGTSYVTWGAAWYSDIRYVLEHPVVLMDSWSAADAVTTILTRSGVSCVMLSLNNLTGVGPYAQLFSGEYGYTINEGITTNQFRDTTIIDEWYSNQVGFPVVLKYAGEAATGSPKPIPILKAENGQGDVKLMWNCYEPHPYVSTYDLGGKSDGYSLFDAANSKIFFAVANPLTGVVSQIVTPENSNIFCDTYAASAFKSATAHMRAGEMLFVYVGVKGVSSTGQKYTTAARLKMSYQNLNP